MAMLALEQSRSTSEKQRGVVASTLGQHIYGNALPNQCFGYNQYITPVTDTYGADTPLPQYVTTNRPVFQRIYRGAGTDQLWTVSGQVSELDAWSAYASALAEMDAKVRAVGLATSQWFTSVLTDHALGATTFAGLPVAASKPERSRPPKALRDIADQLQTELGRLTDGWDGVGGRAPTNATLQAVAKLLSVLPQDAPVPDAEVDGSNGSVSLRWYANNGDSVFSLTVSARRITAISTSRSASKAWEADVEDASRLARVAADHIERA